MEVSMGEQYTRFTLTVHCFLFANNTKTFSLDYFTLTGEGEREVSHYLKSMA